MLFVICVLPSSEEIEVPNENYNENWANSTWVRIKLVPMSSIMRTLNMMTWLVLWARPNPLLSFPLTYLSCYCISYESVQCRAQHFNNDEDTKGMWQSLYKYQISRMTQIYFAHSSTRCEREWDRFVLLSYRLSEHSVSISWLLSHSNLNWN